MIEDPQHPLYGASLKIKRAGDQLKALDLSIKAFFDSKPYTIESQADPNTEILWRVVRVNGSPDPMWSAMTGEIIHNLRCALDYIVFQLVILETGAEPTTKKTQFPIFELQQGFDSRGVPQMLHGVGADAIALIKALQPFATGEGLQSPLIHLRELSNRDKHHSIHLTGASMYRAKVGAVVGHEPTNTMNLAIAKPGPIQDNAPLFGRSIPAGPEPLLERAAKVKVDGEATLHITFEKPPVDFNFSAQDIIHIMGRRVFEIAKRVNAEIFKR